MTYIATTGAILLKSGPYANYSTHQGLTSAARIFSANEQAESFLNAVTRLNLSTSYAGMTTLLKKIIEDAASSHAACSIIGYDMSGYTSRQEALQMLNLNWAKLMECVALLKEKSTTDFMGAS